MTLSSVDKVRLRASDKPVITRERGLGNAEDKTFKLGHGPISPSPAIEVRLNGVTQVSGYTVDTANGIVEFTAAPAVGVDIEFIYYWMIFTDAEIQDFLDEASSSIPVATAKVLLAIAADASKVAQRQAMAGGGGLGSVTLDTSVTARELRATAAAILEMEAKTTDTIPAEGFTEPIWTEFQYRSSTEQRIIRGE